jgi:hypothetical protein
MTEIKREFKGNIGMFLVCAELSKHNLTAMPTSKNMKGYDIVVFNPGTNVGLGLQVKCSDRVKKDGWLIVPSVQWSNYTDKIDEAIIADFVLVDITDTIKPEYYIINMEDMRTIIRSSWEAVKNAILAKKNYTFDKLVEETEKHKPRRCAIKVDQIENYGGVDKHYNNNWQIIIDKLQKRQNMPDPKPR